MSPAPSPFDQSTATVRLEWGPVGAAVLAPAASLCVIVDVLSFTTSVGVAVEGGATVHPFRWRDDRATAYAASLGAELAVARRAAGPRQVSLSSAGLRVADLPLRLVLPSPNGSAICAALGEQSSGPQVVAGSLRNTGAVAALLVEVLTGGGSVALDVTTALHGCASGRELDEGGFGPDVDVAAEVDVSAAVPVLVDGAFTAR